MIRPDVDLLMIPTSKAIKKHVKDRDAFTEIYNRAYEAVMISMEAKEAELADWKADAERLAKTCMATYLTCVHCDESLDEAGEVGHTPNCPITLHRQLVAKYEASPCQK